MEDRINWGNLHTTKHSRRNQLHNGSTNKRDTNIWQQYKLLIIQFLNKQAGRVNCNIVSEKTGVPLNSVYDLLYDIEKCGDVKGLFYKRTLKGRRNYYMNYVSSPIAKPQGYRINKDVK